MAKGLFVRQAASAHGGPSDYEIMPQFMPSSNASICTDDIHITEICFTNNHTSAVTVRMRDNQSTPIPLVPDDMSISAKSTIVVEYPRGALMVGGVSWSASDAAVMVCRMRGF